MNQENNQPNQVKPAQDPAKGPQTQSPAPASQPAKENLSKKQETKEERYKRKIEFQELKKKVMEKEKTNYEYVHLIRQKDAPWWRAYGHSAIILKEYIGPKIRRTFNLLEDTDFGKVSKEGAISIQSIRQLKDQVKAIGFEIVREIDVGVSIRLDRRLPEAEYAVLAQTEQREIDEANKLILPVVSLPDLSVELKILHQNLKEILPKLDVVERGAYGIDMDRTVVNMQRLVARAASGAISKEECLESCLKEIRDFNEFLVVLISVPPVEGRKLHKIAESYVRVKDQIAKQMAISAAEQATERVNGKAVGSKMKVKEKENGEKTSRNEGANKKEPGAEGAGEKAKNAEELSKENSN